VPSTIKMTSSSITRLRSAVAPWAEETPGVVGIEIFGSALHCEDARDIDLLVVYDRNVVSPLDAARSVRSSLSKVAAVCDLPEIDVTLLTVTERAEPGFPSDPESAMALWPAA
jgi:predicted nucleotidyltransferase